MSVEQFAFLRLTDLPTTEAVERSATALGYDLRLDSVDLKTHTGYLPAKLDGVDTGFEVYVDGLAERDDLPFSIDPAWTHACATRTGSDLHEGAAATIFLRAFVDCAGGGYWYPDDDVYCSPGDAAVYLDRQITAFKNLLRRKK